MNEEINKGEELNQAEESSHTKLEFQLAAEKYIKESLYRDFIGNTTLDDRVRREFIYNFMAAIMLEHNIIFSSTDISIQARFKSDKSYIKKLAERVIDGKRKPINDFFAARIIIDSSKDVLPDESPITIKKREAEKLNVEMTQFAERYLVSSETIQELSKIEYYTKLKTLLEGIVKLLPEKATNLIREYEDKIKAADRMIKILEANQYNHDFTENDYVTEYSEVPTFEPNGREGIAEIPGGDLRSEFHDNRKCDFKYYLEEFRKRIDDEYLYAILTKEIDTILKTSSSPKNLLSNFGQIKIVSESRKETENGYVSKFVKIRTIAGEFELQLQTKHQYEEGVRGKASHMNYKFIVPPPTPRDLTDQAEVDQFLVTLKPMLPEYFEAKLEPYSDLSVQIKTESDYTALKRLFQISTNSTLAPFLDSYYKRIYPNLDVLIPYTRQASSFGVDDIFEYGKSEDFNILVEMYKKALEYEKQDQEPKKQQPKIDIKPADTDDKDEK